MITTQKRVCVTETNIRRGKRSGLHDCAVALACKTAYKVKGKAVSVCSSIEVKTKDGMYSMKTPRKVDKFITKFDDYSINRNDLKPFCFNLKLKKD